MGIIQLGILPTLLGDFDVMCRVSVVTISYNQKEYLEECINSVLNQNYKDVEYVVVDPGSTDGSREIIERHEGIVKIFEKDAGPADGLNRGFSRATGDIYGYINSDDALRPNCIQQVVDIFTMNPDVDVVYGHCFVTDEHGGVIRKCFSDQFSLLKAAYGAAMVVQPSTFFRRAIFEKVGGFNVENKSSWDSELFVEFALAGAKMKLINQFWSDYRVHGESITGSGILASIQAQYRRRMFEKIMGRSWCRLDNYISRLMRIKKHLANPKATIERIRYGPIFGRAAK